MVQEVSIAIDFRHAVFLTEIYSYRTKAAEGNETGMATTAG